MHSLCNLLLRREHERRREDGLRRLGPEPPVERGQALLFRDPLKRVDRAVVSQRGVRALGLRLKPGFDQQDWVRNHCGAELGERRRREYFPRAELLVRVGVDRTAC